MKRIYFAALMLCLMAFPALSQSTVEIQSGATITVTAGADISADNAIINGTLDGDGTWNGIPIVQATPPTVVTYGADFIASTEATMRGTVNPNGSPTTGYFEYGTENTLSTCTTTAPQSLGSGTSPSWVLEYPSGLSPNTTYYFRVVGENAGGTVRGSILSFHTLIATTPWVQTNGPTNAHINSLIATPPESAEHFLFAGTEAEGTYRSSDGGTTWTDIGLPNLHIYAFATLSLGQGGTALFAGTNQGMYRSYDYGTTWSSAGLADKVVRALAVGPDASGNACLYVGTQVGFYCSSDEGENWIDLSADLPTTHINCVAIGSDGGGVTSVFAGTPTGLFRLNLDGSGWTSIYMNMYFYSLAHGGSTIVAGTSFGHMRISTDNGVSWTIWQVSDQRLLTVPTLAIVGSKVFIGTPNGIFVATAGGSDWRPVNEGLTNLDIRSFAVSGNNLFTATYGEGVWRRPVSAMIIPPPLVITTAATDIASTSAMLHGSANANGSTTTTYFEWGTDNILSTCSTTTSRLIGDQYNDVNLSEPLSDLTPNTTYYYRIVGENGAGIERGLILSFTTTAVAGFTEIFAGSLPTATEGSVAWGDYDNDGKLDLLITGHGLYGDFSKIYRNTGSGFTEVFAGSLIPVSSGSTAWGDYDNDGMLDILLTGYTGTEYISKIYHNTGSGFSEVSAGTLPGVGWSASSWGDYNNDGKLDILLTGYTGASGEAGYISKIFHNTGNGFVEVFAGDLTGIGWGSAAWGDYDNDGRPDIVLTGQGWFGYVSKIYRNTGTGFAEVFPGSLTIAYYSTVAWGDYDSDGLLDILLTGWTPGGSGGDYQFISKIYHNTGSGFSEVFAGTLTGVRSGAGIWGDYDNDGRADIFLCGFTASESVSKIYHNTGNGFAEIFAGNIVGAATASAAWGDYDNDGDLDIVIAGATGSRLYRNEGTVFNTAPTAPTDLNASVSGNNVTLTWAKASDTQTPQVALTYNLRFGTTPRGVDIVSPMSDAGSGIRQIVNDGNAGHLNSYQLKDLAPGTYYWSVQAIDNGYASSAFAAEGTAEVAPPTSALFNGQSSRMRIVDGQPATSDANQEAYKIGGNAITVEAWVYPLSLMDLQRGGNTIVARPSNGTFTDPYFSYALTVDHASGSPLPAFVISDGSPGSEKVVTAPDPLHTFRWTHIAGTYDGSTLKIYVNDELRNQISTNISISPDGVGFYIGRFLTDAFQGAITEVRLWNAARTLEEIGSTMNGPLTGNEPGLVGYWNMNSSFVANDPLRQQDLTSNHNDLRIQGTTPVIPFNPYTSYGTTTFSCAPTSLNFGDVEQAGDIATQPVRVSNDGNAPLLGVFELNSSTARLASNFSFDLPFFLPPNEGVDLPMGVRALVDGSISGTINLHTNTTIASTIAFTMSSTARLRLDANNVGMWTLPDGRFAHNVFDGFEWPKGSGKTMLYQAGLWVGANVNGNVRTAVASYNSEFQPGPILGVGGYPGDPNDPRYRVYKISAGDDGSNPDFAAWPADLGAPVNPDGTPRVLGDQTLFSVYNDLDVAKHYHDSQPLGVEVQQTTFAFHQSGALDNTVFLRFKVTNKSTDTWNDAYVALWSDPDMGNPFDDLAGVDVPRDLGYIYNGRSTDAVYNIPPAVGIDVLKGAFYTKPIQGFVSWTGAEGYPYKDPVNSGEDYNFMSGLLADGTSFIDPTTNIETTFMFPGDPVTGTGWVQSNPNDRRILFSTGPFTLEPGQSKEFIAAIIAAQGTNNLASITALRNASDQIQALFDNGQVFGGALESVVSASAAEGNAGTLDDISQSGAVLTFTGGSGGGSVELATYIEAPPGAQSITTPSIGSFGNYLDVQVQGSVEWPLFIRLYYTRNDLLQAGLVESDLQGIYYWNGASTQWILYSLSGADDQGRGPSKTGVNATNVTINGVEYEGFVGARAYHLTPIVIGAKTETISERFTEAIQFVQSLPEIAFKKPAETRRSGLIGAITHAEELLAAGNLRDALDQLAGAVTNHLTAQGNNGQNLWVTDEESRAALSQMVGDIVDLLQRPQSLAKKAGGNAMVQGVQIPVPTEYGLSQNYPNPFNPSTTIAYQIPKASSVKLTVYNMLGEEVATLVSGEKGPGYYQVRWQPHLPSGMYIYRLRAGEFVQSRKLMLLK